MKTTVLDNGAVRIETESDEHALLHRDGKLLARVGPNSTAGATRATVFGPATAAGVETEGQRLGLVKPSESPAAQVARLTAERDAIDAKLASPELAAAVSAASAIVR